MTSLRTHCSILLILFFFQIHLFASDNCVVCFFGCCCFCDCFCLFSWCFCWTYKTLSCTSLWTKGEETVQYFTSNWTGQMCNVGITVTKPHLQMGSAYYTPQNSWYCNANNIVGLFRAYCGPNSQMILKFLLEYSKYRWCWAIRIWDFASHLPWESVSFSWHKKT